METQAHSAAVCYYQNANYGFAKNARALCPSQVSFRAQFSESIQFASIGSRANLGFRNAMESGATNVQRLENMSNGRAENDTEGLKPMEDYADSEEEDEDGDSLYLQELQKFWVTPVEKIQETLENVSLYSGLPRESAQRRVFGAPMFMCFAACLIANVLGNVQYSS